jgi:phosphoglycolate phosphatase-like HAD superfamily hydrolase
MVPIVGILACIFDLDGTLIDSKRGFERSLHKSLSAHGCTVGDMDLGKLIGPPISKILAKAAPALPPQLVKEIVASFRREFDSTGCIEAELFPNVKEVLRLLRKSKVSLFLVTNKPQLATTRVLRHFGLKPFFSQILCLDHDCANALTKQKLIETAVISSGLKSEQVLIVGDTLEDWEAALATGCRFSPAFYGYGNLRAHLESSPLCLEKPKDLLKVLKIRE